MPGAIMLEALFQTLLDREIVAPLVHVDEIDHDQAGEIAQPQLACHFLGRFEIGLERGILDRTFLGGAARVHIDRHQRLCHADHDIAAGLELHRRVEHPGKIALHLIAGEKRQRIGVLLHVLGVGRHDHLHEILRRAIALIALDKHLINLAVVEIAD